jgi:hypothetical protein
MRLKNIKDAQGNFIKTICSTDVPLSQGFNRRNCESSNMNILRVTPEIQASVLDYASDQYRRFKPTYIFYEGDLGNNNCRCISNENTTRNEDFKKHYCACSDPLFAMCEFKYPRGKLQDSNI